MGLFQRAVEAYDSLQSIAGEYQEGKVPLAPIGYITTRASYIITIDKNGKFISAEKFGDKILIPVTEKSATRVGNPCAHPLCDQIVYLSGEDKDKFASYISQLEDWCCSPYGYDKGDAILTYVKQKNVIGDLVSNGIIELDEDGTINMSKIEKNLIIWRVLGCSEPEEVWKDTALMKSFADYYLSKASEDQNGLCYVSGDEALVAESHIKGVMSLNGNAKLISSNDDVNFTYRGRFKTDKEAVEVSYIASQKAHNALKWLIDNESAIEAKRAFVCFSPKGKPTVSSPFDILIKDEEEVTIDTYKAVLEQIVSGLKSNFTPIDTIVVASFDAATTGRLAVTYYNEFGAYDFFDRLKHWDESISFPLNAQKISTPYIRQIVNVAFGVQRGDDETAWLETDPKLAVQHIQRLFACRMEGTPFPTDIMLSAVMKAGSLVTYNTKNKRNVLYTACAVVRKYRYDHFKEEWKMALEKDRLDRSYQYGRLLAVFDKIESETYDNENIRDTNAMRSQSAFVRRPAYMAAQLSTWLKTGYYPKLSFGRKAYFEKLIGEIMEMISKCDCADLNMPLKETYLLGYYLQKNDFYTKKSDNDNENNNSEE